MSLSTLSEPDCSGMCSDGITFGVSAIAAITSSVNSAGCGRGEPHPLQPLDLAAGAQQLGERLPVAELDAVGVDVLAEQGDLGDALGDQRLDLGEDLAGPAVLLLAAQRRDDAERAGVVAARPRSTPTRRTPTRAWSAASRGTPRATRGSRPAPPRRPAPARAAPAASRCCGCRRRRRPTGARRVISPRSFCARQPPTAICMPGLRGLHRRQVAEVAVELVVGVLPHRAGVEHDDVGLLVRRARRRTPRPPAARSAARSRGRSSGSRRCGPRRCARGRGKGCVMTGPGYGAAPGPHRIPREGSAGLGVRAPASRRGRRRPGGAAAGLARRATSSRRSSRPAPSCSGLLRRRLLGGALGARFGAAARRAPSSPPSGRRRPGQRRLRATRRLLRTGTVARREPARRCRRHGSRRRDGAAARRCARPCPGRPDSR